MFQTIQTIYFLWGYDPGNMSVSFIAELSPVYRCLVHMCFGIRISSPFHPATQIISILNLNCPKNAETHARTWLLSQLLEVKLELKLELKILSRFHALGCLWFLKHPLFFRVNIQWKCHGYGYGCVMQFNIHERKLHIYGGAFHIYGKSFQKSCQRICFCIFRAV